MAQDTSKFSPTHKRILDCLSDGKMHTKDEIKKVIDVDEKIDLVSQATLTTTISNLRKILEKHGETIICQVHYGRFYYRHVRLISTDNA